jgi:2-polyprenyl-3-methyl-5-hydroxy-6-metoxy-1,4-benzoquinol methylase
MTEVPTNCNLLWKNKEAAINCPKGDIVLAFCPVCSLITNLALEPKKNKYTRLYDNSLFYSPLFQNFARELASDLIRHYDLHNKNIVEIGCGKSDFLQLLCELGNNHGLEFDPTYSKLNDRSHKKGNRVKFIPKFYSKRHEDYKADFIFSYHVLEHMNYPNRFLRMLRRMIGNRPETHVFFAVPNALKDFEEIRFLDIIYEHVSYFTLNSLAFIFSSCGFSISEIADTQDKVSIYVDAVPEKRITLGSKRKPSFDASQIEDCITSFATRSSIQIEKYKDNLQKLLNKGKRVAIWGAGARGVTFLNLFKDPRIKYAIDINPRKQGTYVPGTGQMIVEPKYLLEYQPDYVVIMNPTYEKEIKRLAENLGIETNFICA